MHLFGLYTFLYLSQKGGGEYDRNAQHLPLQNSIVFIETFFSQYFKKKKYKLNYELVQELKVDEDRVGDELKEQARKREELERDEERYWREYSRHKQQLLQAEDEYRNKIHHA